MENKPQLRKLIIALTAFATFLCFALIPKLVIQIPIAFALIGYMVFQCVRLAQETTPFDFQETVMNQRNVSETKQLFLRTKQPKIIHVKNLYLQIDYRSTGSPEIYVMKAAKSDIEKFYEENIFGAAGSYALKATTEEFKYPLVLRDLSKELDEEEILNYALHKKHAWVRII